MPVSFHSQKKNHPKSLYSHELHLQYNKDQMKIWLDAVKLKKESEKLKKALCKKNEKKRKAEAIGGHSEITTDVAHEDEFSAVLEPQGPSKFNKDDFVTVKSDTTSGVHIRFFYEMSGIVQENGKWKHI
jgi:hypothetical protein